MDCDVCIDSNADSEFFYERIRIAKRPGKNCAECGQPRKIGDSYMQVGGKCEGQFWQETLCLLCHEIANVFYCNGVMYGNIWEEIEDYAFPNLRTSSPCFQKLSLPAREHLVRRWWKWKEITG